MKKQRIVVKIGSSSLTNANGGLCKEKLVEHTAAIAALKHQGHQVLLISSGAVAAGFKDLGYPTRPVTVAGKQAAAAVGQGLLMHGYAEAFRQHDIVCAQLLLTRHDFSEKGHYQNAYQTLNELLKRDIVPVINENDSVAVDELTFGDNDMLSALVSGMMHADFLIMLTDIDGLYATDPRRDPHAVRYDSLSAISPELLVNASGGGSRFGTGGMKSKLMAAQIALSLGVKTFIGKGSGAQKLLRILAGEGEGTYIGQDAEHHLKSIKNPKQWLRFHSQVHGQIVVDKGAVQAISRHGKSILPAGVTQIHGHFTAGQVVEVLNEEHEKIGKGQSNYAAEELRNIIGTPSRIAMRITKRKQEEVIHRDQLLIYEEGEPTYHFKGVEKP